MAFADLKNDFVFRRIFATHPDILRRLLNDLLECEDAQTIEQIEYLPREQVPVVEGAKFSILNVRCKNRAGTTFVVEMQLLHYAGFINRAVYNACKTYVGQLKEGDWYTKLTDVVAISVCEFELWPDAAQEKKGLPRVPMLSRWNMTEQSSNNQGLLQVQYAFLELPKMPDRRPDKPGADLWTWLFVHATELTEVPADLTSGPYGDALELANKAKFTATELQVYEKTRDEIWQVIEFAEARWAEGKAEGEREAALERRLEGKIEAKRETLLRLLVRVRIALTDTERARVEACLDAETLDRWIENVFGAKTAADVLT